jgi:hypothetical protein
VEDVVDQDAGRARGVRRCVFGLVVFALVASNAVGLCVTYGFPEIAW